MTDGQVEVSRDGLVLRSLGPGHGVGEISLLRDVPRTASVRAIGPVRAYALERGAFLSAVTGHSAARSAAHSIVDEHLARSAAAETPGMPPPRA